MLTKDEKGAIKKLEKLAKEWPDSLMLFSWSGSLCVVARKDGEVVATINGIPNDGGGPREELVDGISYMKM